MRNIFYKITIKGKLDDLNTYISAERSHRQKGAEMKRINTEIVEWQTKNLEPIKHYPLHMHILWFTKDERIDADNIAFAKKYILDGLVRSGVIKDDNRKHIKSFSDEFAVDKNERAEITLTYKRSSV